MTKRLFIGGLPYSMDDTQLTDLFAKVGKVASANVIIDKYTSQSKGFGFVEMENDADAEEAIKQLEGTEVQGRKITVSIAKPREERSSSFGASRSNGYGNNRNSRNGGQRY